MSPAKSTRMYTGCSLKTLRVAAIKAFSDVRQGTHFQKKEGIIRRSANHRVNLEIRFFVWLDLKPQRDEYDLNGLYSSLVRSKGALRRCSSTGFNWMAPIDGI